MASSSATTVPQYLAELPEDRRQVIAAVRKVIRRHLPKGYRETMNWGMICYEVPLKRYPNTYNGQPLMFAALAAQKNHYGLYLTSAYQCPLFLQALQSVFAAAGKKLDMGKSCVRFRQLDDLPLDAIGELLEQVSVDTFLAQYEAARRKS